MIKWSMRGNGNLYQEMDHEAIVASHEVMWYTHFHGLPFSSMVMLL